MKIYDGARYFALLNVSLYLQQNQQLCSSPSDEINWPEKDEAPPPDAQDLIAFLLRQNPLERLGTG